MAKTKEVAEATPYVISRYRNRIHLIPHGVG